MVIHLHGGGHMMHKDMWKKAADDMLRAVKTIARYEDVKKERQRAKEGKMKLEAGKYYELVGGKVHKAEACGELWSCVKMGEFHYDALKAEPWSYDASRGAPNVLREVPAPLRLEVGKLYETTDGAKWCTHVNKMYDQYKVGAHWYHKDGSLGACGDDSVPRILHRIKLNEPVSTSGEKFQQQVKKAQDAIAAVRERREEINRMREFAYTLGPACRDAMLGCLAQYEDKVYISVGETQRADTIRKRYAEPTPVTYKPHTDCGKREVEIPPGYEKYTGKDVPMLIPAGSGMNSSSWEKCFILNLSDEGYKFAVLDSSVTIIRPKPAPFRLSGPGWYKGDEGSWIDLRGELGWYGDGDAWAHARYIHNGRRADGLPVANLIARATPEQAKVLDAL